MRMLIFGRALADPRRLRGCAFAIAVGVHAGIIAGVWISVPDAERVRQRWVSTTFVVQPDLGPRVIFCRMSMIGELRTVPHKGRAIVAPDGPRYVRPEALEWPKRQAELLNAAVQRALPAPDRRPRFAAVKVCLDKRGVPTRVELLKSTDSPHADDLMRRELLSWRYPQFVRDGVAVSVCTAFLIHLRDGD